MVKRLGGTPTAMYIGSVTHILAGKLLPLGCPGTLTVALSCLLTACKPPSCGAANDKGEVAKHRQHDRDVISVQWLLDCAREGRRVAVPPRYYLHRSRASILVGAGLGAWSSVACRCVTGPVGRQDVRDRT